MTSGIIITLLLLLIWLNYYYYCCLGLVETFGSLTSKNFRDGNRDNSYLNTPRGMYLDTVSNTLFFVGIKMNKKKEKEKEKLTFFIVRQQE